MIYLLSFFWLLRTTKAILFWLYLWQLKEYHIGRFLDHFRTEKGKRLLFNYLQFLKIFLISGPFLFPFFFPFILIFLYFAESIIFFKNLFQKRLIKPVLTIKTAFLISITLFLEFFVLFMLFLNVETLSLFAFWLLIFDIFTPVITSAIVLIFQPLAVLARNQIIRKAKKKRNQFKDLLVIGITGAYGKTSTKEFLATILAEKFKVLKTKEHQNSEVGISRCILNELTSEHEIFVCEMGAYNRGGVKLLCDIAKPKIGILTGINEQHLATFGSLENIIKTKYELIESLPEDGLIIFNGDSSYCFELYKKTKKPKRFYSLQLLIAGLEPEIRAENILVEKNFISFKAKARNGEQADFKVNLLGGQDIENMLAAILCAQELGMSLKEIAKASEKISPERGAMKLLKGKNDLNIIDSTYSANPDGVISHLEYLKIWSGKKIIVMPCLIELGKVSKEVHQRIGKKIGQICDLAIITTKERFKEVKEGVRSTIRGGEIEILFLENPKEIYDKIKAFCQPGDVVLLEGRVPSQLMSLLVKELL